MAGAPEGSQPSVIQTERTRSREELSVFDIGAGPSAFDVVDAKLIQPSRYSELVFDGERNAFALRSVSERRVVDPDSHVIPPTSIHRDRDEEADPPRLSNRAAWACRCPARLCPPALQKSARHRTESIASGWRATSRHRLADGTATHPSVL